MISLRTWSRNPRVAWQMLAGEGVLIHLATGQTLGLNETGGFIWSKIDELSIHDIGLSLASRHDISAEVARSDVAEFVELLAAEDFLIPASEQ